MVLVGADTEHQEQHCSCLFLTKSTMGSSETFFVWRGTSELNGPGTGNQTPNGSRTFWNRKKRIFLWKKLRIFDQIFTFLSAWMLMTKTKPLDVEWKGINCKQSTRWQHLYRLKASVFFSLPKKVLVVMKHNNLYCVTEPHWITDRRYAKTWWLIYRVNYKYL